MKKKAFEKTDFIPQGIQKTKLMCLKFLVRRTVYRVTKNINRERNGGATGGEQGIETGSSSRTTYFQEGY